MSILEQQLLGYIKNKPNIGLKELKGKLEKNYEGEQSIEDTLYSLEVQGMIYLNKDNTYCLLSNKPSICQGKAHFLASGDMIVCDKQGNKVIVPQEKTAGILEKDIVTITKRLVDNKGNVYGELDKIIKRKRNQVSCEIVFKDGKSMLIPYNSNSQSMIRVNQEKLNKYGVGEILLIKLNSQDSEFDGEIYKSLGHKNDPDVDEKTIICDHGFETQFSSKTLKELEKIPTYVDSKKALKEGRRDLRDKVIFTIDGKDTKDIDDSVGVEKLPNGNYKLYVNISDVGYYVKENTSINNEAYCRGTSVYVNEKVAPMFHPKISNGICSLFPNVDRLTKTCEMIINKEGKIVDYDIYDSIIRSRKKMTYEDVNRILIDNEKVDGYEEFNSELKTMRELSDILDKAKIKRGYLNFNKADIKAKGKGQTINFEIKKNLVAEKIIENFMLAANETVAQHIFYRGLPFIYRVHEVPDEDKLHNFLEVLETMGFNFKKCKNITSNKYVQGIIKEISLDDENQEALTELLLINTMKRAKYTNINIGHFGLALKCYTHFTSPIRRYADLQVHRLLDLYKNFYDFDYSELEKYLSTVANHCTERSNEADKAEREAKEMRIAEFLENNIGKCFEGIIVSLDSSCVKVKTKEGFTGTISIKDLPGNQYKYDASSYTLTEKHMGQTYSLGSPMEIKVKEASKRNRTVKFTTKNQPIKDSVKTKRRRV